MSPDGFLVVDKPAGWTSHDVVARLRRAAGTRRVGHAGTLDPAATGVLVVGVGWSTKLLTHVVGVDKAYEATVRLGRSTTTDDAEGEPTGSADAAGVTDEAVRTAVAGLTGAIEQVPSAVSAIKVDGRRAYARVRAGEQVRLAARPVVVSRFEVLATRRPAPDGPGVLDLGVSVACSSGTYVRALARDLGTALGVGGHLTALRRTRVGPWTLADAVPLAELTGPDGLPAGALLPPGRAAGALLGTVRLPDADLAAVRHGRPVPSPAPDAFAPPAGSPVGEPVREPLAGLAGDGTLVALLRRDGAGLRPVTVVPPA